MRNGNGQPEGAKNWKTGERETASWAAGAGISMEEFRDGGAEHLHPLAALAINLLKTNKIPDFEWHNGSAVENNHLPFTALFYATFQKFFFFEIKPKRIKKKKTGIVG